MNSLCKSFSDCSAEVKRWLTKQPEVKEETLTDWLLYSLSEKIPAIKYRQFTRTEEGRKTGADWEWWFVFSNKKSFAARVQAKKLKSNIDCYPGIAYTRNDRLQIERLLDDSAKDGLASFYSFYSIENGKSTMCSGQMNGEGVYLAEANKLRDEFILKSRIKLFPQEVLKFCNPVSCLFCCPMTYEAGKNIEEGFRRYLNQYFPTYSSNLGERQNIQELGFRDTPNYIQQLLDTAELPDWWETEYRSYLEKTNAILIIDLRNIEKYNSR